MSDLVSVVVPMYRTAATLDELYERMKASIPDGFVAEFVFVDDACDQGSGAALVKLQRSDPSIQLVSHSGNRGQHQAIRSGLAVSSGHIVAVLDGDLQDPPEALPLLIETLLSSSVDAVFAGKSGNFTGVSRRLSGTVFKMIMHLSTGVPIDAGGYVIMTRPLVDDLLVLNLGSPYLLANIAATKRPTMSIPVPRSARPVGSSAMSGTDRLKLGAGAFWALARERFR
ncbi:MAG: glycosyltransferase family 2 protein [Acidimicrobiaceae bacterium]|jgi:polyisoprenyl-phosphate glycosyltransferase|nr:glycosyltransferase family 2 protein [Acidimicrobiaceae bacterium]